MSFLSKISSRFTSQRPNVENKARRILTNRFCPQDGFMPMGAVMTPPRQNTTDELIKSIEAYADIYESGSKSAEPKLIALAKEYGVDLQKEAKKLGVDIFEAAKKKGSVEADIKYVDWFTGKEQTKHSVLNLTEVATDIEAQKRLGESNSRELRKFLAQVGGMSLEHLGVAHDIIDLAHMGAYLNTNISLQKMLANGRTVMGDILAKFPEVSRKNPGAIDLTGEVFSHGDDTNSKYFVEHFFNRNLENFGYLSEQMKALRELVPIWAKEFLSGGYLMDYSKENKFFNSIAAFCRPDAKPENIRTLRKVIDITDAAPGSDVCHGIDELGLAFADTKKLNENIEYLPELLEHAGNAGQSLNISDFLTKNVNLT